MFLNCNSILCSIMSSVWLFFLRLWSVMEVQSELQSTVQQWRSSIFLLRPRVMRKRMMAGRLCAGRSDWTCSIRTDAFLHLRASLSLQLLNPQNASGRWFPHWTSSLGFLHKCLMKSICVCFVTGLVFCAYMNMYIHFHGLVVTYTDLWLPITYLLLQ